MGVSADPDSCSLFLPGTLIVEPLVPLVCYKLEDQDEDEEHGRRLQGQYKK